MEIQFQETSLLRPQQVEELKSEKTRLEDALKDPRARLEDRQGAVRTVKKIERQLEFQVPKPFKGEELDAAIRAEREIRGELTQDMLTQEEMRRSPSGAVGRHMAWEKKNKRKVARWKELRLRINHDSQDPDIANLERYRPSTGGTLNMDTAQIPQKTGFFFPDSISIKNVMDPEERARVIQETEAFLKTLKEIKDESTPDTPKKGRKGKAVREG